MTGCTVMVVEDDHDIRESLRDLLEMEGYEVVTATNGREALDLLADGRLPSLMLLDLMMPVMNGWQVLETVRSDSRLSPLPIIVVTAQPGRAPGANGFIRKPFSLEGLIDTVSRFCSPAANGAPPPTTN